MKLKDAFFFAQLRLVNTEDAESACRNVVTEVDHIALPGDTCIVKAEGAYLILLLNIYHEQMDREVYNRIVSRIKFLSPWCTVPMKIAAEHSGLTQDFYIGQDRAKIIASESKEHLHIIESSLTYLTKQDLEGLKAQIAKLSLPEDEKEDATFYGIITAQVEHTVKIWATTSEEAEQKLLSGEFCCIGTEQSIKKQLVIAENEALKILGQLTVEGSYNA